MTAQTLFISDLHLDQQAPEITERFIHFMEQQAPNADALYILGDLFEAWIGDDDLTPFHQQIITIIRHLADKGVPIYFMRGNRDFLIGQRFAQASGVTILPDPFVIELYNKPIVLTHGDILCTLDIKHQQYRKKVMHPWGQKVFLTTPLWFRRKFAQKLRKKSRHHNQQATSHITDVTPEEVLRMMEQHHVDLMIHGHTHRPAIHDNAIGKRVVLGSWHDDISVLRYGGDGLFQLLSDTGSNCSGGTK